MIRVTTRHPEDFNILCEDIDPTRSLYAEYNDRYASKVKALYAELGIQTAIWTTPEDQPPAFFEPGKPVEHLLEVEESRIIAYVDELTWSPFLFGDRPTFDYSRTSVRYDMTSILVGAPIRPEEVKEVRRYRCGPRRNCELVEKRPWLRSTV